MKAIVLFSGGLDSTTLLAKVIKIHGADNVTCLSLLYGQKHKKELECSKKIVEHYKVKHKIIDVKKLFEGSDCTLLEGSKKEVPVGSYAEQKNEEDVVSTYVPFRNGLFISIATTIAIIEKCEVVYYGIHKDDYIGSAYPDCSSDFQEAINKAIYLGSGNYVKVLAPFVEMDKAGIVKEGLELNVPYELTWSCYEGGEKPCGKCGTCIDRQIAFEKNGVKDPLYE